MMGGWISAPAVWGLALATLQLAGCASAQFAAPKTAAGSVADEAQAAPEDKPRARDPEGVGDLVEKPVAQVDQVDNAWGVPLVRVKDAQRRAAIARDLDALITRRARAGEPAPTEARLVVVSPQLTLLVATPAGLRVGAERTLLVVVWDTSGEAAPELAARFAGAAAAPVGAPRQQGASREHRFRLRAERAGPAELALAVRRGEAALASPKLALQVGAAERP